jgi:uncharacterized protein (DUF4415 family)
MTGKRVSGKPPSTWVDPDEAPELTREWFEGAALYRGGELIRPGKPIADPEAIIRRGRPRKPDAKEAISLRVDPDVLEVFRAMGDGWQTQMNAVLKAYVLNDPLKRFKRGAKVPKARVGVFTKAKARTGTEVAKTKAALKAAKKALRTPAARVGSARRGRDGG